MDPIALISSLVNLANAIFTQVKIAKTNPRQCQRLYKRVNLVVKTLQGLDRIPNSQNFKDALLELEKWMKECVSFIEEFTQEKGFCRLLKAGMHKERFVELNAYLGSLVEQLNLGISTQSIINHEQDRQDLAEDYDDLKKGQGALLELQGKVLAEVQAQHLDQEHLHEVIERQLLSMRNHLDDLVAGKPKSSLIDEKYLIPYFCIEFDTELARGSFGVVYRGKWSGQSVAVKMAINSMGKEESTEFMREVQIMSRLRSEYITQFYGVCLEEGKEGLVMEYMADGPLYEALRDRKFSNEEKQRLALDIAYGLNYLHHQGVVHRDLKSHNVLLDRSGKAKLTNFGLSMTQASSVLKLDKGSQAIRWLAPEVLKRAPHTEQSDIYSYGIILWEIVTGKIPYSRQDDTEVFKKVLSGEREKIPADVVPEWSNLITRCWAALPAERPSLEEIIAVVSTKLPLRPTGEELYQKGVNAEKTGNLVQAREFYQDAVALGFCKAYANLGYFYLKGLGGLVANKKLAYECFLKGAEAGHARAQCNLARMLEKGDGIEQDLERALHWYREAAKSGDTAAVGKVVQLSKMIEESLVTCKRTPT